VVTNHTHAAFSATVDINAYKTYNSILRLEEILGTPLAIAARAVYDNFDEWAAITNFRSPNLFFIEDGCLDTGDMMECLKDRDGMIPPVPVPKGLEPCQAADLYCYGMYTFYRDRKKPYLLECFDQKLKDIYERRDAFIGLDELKQTLGRPIVHATVNYGAEEKMLHVPLRRKTEGIDFNFVGNKKRQRIRRVKG
jgi:hypothetical protein